MVSLSYLTKVEAFKGMTQAQFMKLEPYCEGLKFQNGDRLFAEGDPADHLWVVIQGAVDLRFELPDKRPTTAEHTVSSIAVDKLSGEGQTFGWSCFVPPHKMRLSAYCVSDNCETIRVAKVNLLRLFDYDPHMGYIFLTYLIKVVGHRFHHLQDIVAKSEGRDIMSGW